MNLNFLTCLSLVVLVTLRLTSKITLASGRLHDNEPSNRAAPALWLAQYSGANLSENDTLTKYIDRVGPNMRSSSDYHDYTDVKLNESIQAWKLMQQQFKQFAQDQVLQFRPKLEELIYKANVSMPCQQSIEIVLDALERLDSWAVQMWSSTGNFPPNGIFDGQFTNVGSYRNCVDLSIPNDDQLTKNHKNVSIDYTSYCSVPFRPLVPKRPPYHVIYQRVPKQLINLFNETDVFHWLATHAQYFHYVYLRTDICVPYKCSPQDIQQVAGIVGRNLILTVGPVRCYTRAPHIPKSIDISSTETYSKLIDNEDQNIEFGDIENKAVLVETNRPINQKQRISLILIGTFFTLVFMSSLWHFIELSIISFKGEKDQEYYSQEEKLESLQRQDKSINEPLESTQKPMLIDCDDNHIIKNIAFNYLSLITNGRIFFDTKMKSNEIKCLHGLRVITMVWIVTVHTLQYNEWSGFTRIFEIIPTFKNPALQPIFNGNYLVDNFFLMSGLLVSYTAWYASRGTKLNFEPHINLIGRYLRLTPQVFLISLLYILLPLVGDGPFWYNMTHDSSRYCEKNWWINLLHLQAFYEKDEMCNLVSWWISVDMFYYVIALAIVYMILSNQQKKALTVTSILVGLCLLITTYQHYNGGFTPNNLASVPQVNEVWTDFVVHFSWSPYPHAFPFFLGLWIGYIMANNKWRSQVRNWSRVGWTLSTLCFVIVNFSSYIWLSGLVEIGQQYVSTAYNVICSILWALAYSWLIIGCHYGCAPTLNKLLSIKMFVLISKASFIIYLSHMLLLRTYFGLQNYVLELSPLALNYIVIGNVALSIVFGVFLSISFEGPFMKIQRKIIQTFRFKTKCSIQGADFALNSRQPTIGLTTKNGRSIYLAMGMAPKTSDNQVDK